MEKANIVHVNVNMVGMSLDYYSDKIHANKPYEVFQWTSEEKHLDDGRMLSFYVNSAVRDYLDTVSDDGLLAQEINLYSKVFIKYGEYFVSLGMDKNINDIIRDLELELLCVEIFVFGGGASLQNHGYSFVVHSEESVHKYKPHIHVKRDGESVRYMLDPIERFENDKVSRGFIRDEKKIIIPFIEKNQALFKKWWNKSMQGYNMPELDDQGVQYIE